jgi:hypothetical protein
MLVTCAVSLSAHVFLLCSTKYFLLLPPINSHTDDVTGLLAGKLSRYSSRMRQFATAFRNTGNAVVYSVAALAATTLRWSTTKRLRLERKDRYSRASLASLCRS